MSQATVKSVQQFGNYYSVICTVNNQDYNVGILKSAFDALPDNQSKLNLLKDELNLIRQKNILGDYITTYNGLTFNVIP